MGTIRCTLKLLKRLGVKPVEEPQPPAARLGDWYANVIPTDAGELILFVSERSLLSVAIPASQSDELTPLFLLRVANLLSMIGVSNTVIDRELEALQPIQFGKTASRQILGAMNEIAFEYQVIAEKHVEESGGRASEALSLSDTEYRVSGFIHSPTNYRKPREFAMELLNEGWKT